MEEATVETPKENTLPKPQPMIVKKNNNAPLVGAIIFLALVIGAAAVYLGTQKNNEIAVAIPTTPTPTIATQNTPSSPPSASPVQDITLKWESANIPKLKDSSFYSFNIKHPADWVAKASKNEVSQTLTITKGKNEIKIYQAPMGGGGCIFEGDVPEGPFSDYRNASHVDIKVGNLTIKRVEVGKNSYAFCGNSTNSISTFGVPTLFGVISYEVESSNAEILAEMDKILSTLKAQE